jgi:hypothetical protein
VASGHPAYDVAHAGTSSVGLGFSATESPLMEEHTQRVLALSLNDEW